MTKDPTRWSDLPDAPKLGELMRAARERVPNQASLEAMLAKVEAAAAAAPATGAGVTNGKLALGAVAALGAAGVVAWLALAEPGKPVVAPTAALIASAIPSAPLVSKAKTEPVPAPSASSALESKPKRAASPTPSSGSAAVPSELELIRDARAALATAPARALTLTQQHARSYPGGALAQEREVIAIEALTALGERAQAKTRAVRFVAAHPDSAYVLRLERAVGSLRDRSNDALENSSPGSQKN